MRLRESPNTFMAGRLENFLERRNQSIRTTFCRTINLYFSPIPLLYPPTFLSKNTESEYGKRRVRICRNPSHDPCGSPHGKTLYVGLESVLGIGEGVPIPIPGGRSLPGGRGVGTVWAAKESL
jgi:hypothetical protein